MTGAKRIEEYNVGTKLKGQYSLRNIVEQKDVQETLMALHISTGVGMALFDTQFNLLYKNGGNNICEKFHHKYTDECLRCPSFIKGYNLSHNKADQVVNIPCPFGYNDILMPITVKGQVYGYLFFGQFLLDNQTLNESLIIENVKKFGFDEGEYHEALSMVPILSSDKVDYVKEVFSKTFQINGEVSEDSNDHTFIEQVANQQRTIIDAVEGFFQVESRYQAVLNAMNEGLVIHGADGTIIACNSNAEKILGLTRSQLEGKTFINNAWNAIHEDGSDFPGDEHPSVVTLKSSEPMRDVVMGLRKTEGKVTWIRINTEPIIDASSNKLVAVTLLFTDFTSDKLHKEDLVQQAQNKNRLFAIVAHDLKEPVGSIKEITDFIIESIDSNKLDEAKRLLRALKKTSNNTFQLVTQLLDWASVQLKQVSTDKAYFRMDKLVAKVVDEFSTTIKNKEIDLKIAIEPFLAIFHDKNVIHTILRNLISNALKYTHNNGVIIVSAHSLNNEVVVSVSDNGIGIPKKLIDSIISRELIRSRQGTNNEKGHGLGLSMCNHLLNQCGGRLVIESIEGKGASMYVYIPIEK